MNRKNLCLVDASFSEIVEACVSDPTLIRDILLICAKTASDQSADLYAVSEGVVDHIRTNARDAPEIDEFMVLVAKMKGLTLTVEKAMNAANYASVIIQSKNGRY
jgi:hypothetical protein